MKINWIYTLVILFFIFGTLYFMGTFFGTQYNIIQTWITPLTDLWANLFATVIAIVVLERIIHRVGIEKNQQSITFAKGRIVHVLINLIISAKPPANWENDLTTSKFDWQNYIQRLRNSQNYARQELVTILDRYNRLLESELMNDLFVLVSVLDVQFINLAGATRSSVLYISESMKIIEQHKLLENTGVRISFKKGESPEVDLGKGGVYEPTQYSLYSEWLKDAIKFKDSMDGTEFARKLG